MLCWNLISGPKHRVCFKKTWLSLKRISYFQLILMLLGWSKRWYASIWNGTENGLSNIEDTFPESFQLQISVLHQSLCIFKAGLSSLSHGWAKYKQKVPHMSDSNQNLETICNSKLKFAELKISSKGCQRTSQRWIMYSYIANTAIL